MTWILGAGFFPVTPSLFQSVSSPSESFCLVGKLKVPLLAGVWTVKGRWSMVVPWVVTRVKVMVPPGAIPAWELPLAGVAVQSQSADLSQEITSKPRGTEIVTSRL